MPFERTIARPLRTKTDRRLAEDKTVVAITSIPDVVDGKRPKLWTQLYFQVLVAIAAGVMVGVIWPETGAALKPLGDAFIKLVKMVIAPLIFLTIVTGIAGMGELKSVGRVAGRAFLYFFFFSTLALVIGLVVANLVQPGTGMNIDPATLDTKAVSDYTAKAHDQTLVGFLGSGLIDQSQKMTVAARATAEKKAFGQRS